MLKYILPIVPEHTTYTESFFGGGALFFVKEPAKCEVINDTNKEAVNFYSVIVKDFIGLQSEISSTLHSRSSFDDAKIINQHPHLFDETKRAWAFYTLCHQSFSCDMVSFGYEITGSKKMPNTINNKKEMFSNKE